jgi:hypothetical protein
MIPPTPGQIILSRNKNIFHPLDMIIRIRTAGIKSMFKKNIATHAGIITSMKTSKTSTLLVQEMRHDCIRTPLKGYENRFHSSILMVGFPPLPDGTPITVNIVNRILAVSNSIYSGSPGYDYLDVVLDFTVPELLRQHQSWLDCTGKHYCSEHVAFIYKKAGHLSFQRSGKPESPFSLQKIMQNGGYNAA